LPSANYFRKAGVPQVDEKGQPILMRPASRKKVRKISEAGVHRLADSWAHWGKQYGYFNTDEDSQAFYDDWRICCLCRGRAQFSAVVESGLQFGLRHDQALRRGIGMSPEKTTQLDKPTDAYTHPQPHACFIQSWMMIWSMMAASGPLDARSPALQIWFQAPATNFSKLRGRN